MLGEGGSGCISGGCYPNPNPNSQECSVRMQTRIVRRNGESSRQSSERFSSRYPTYGSVPLLWRATPALEAFVLGREYVGVAPRARPIPGARVSTAATLEAAPAALPPSPVVPLHPQRADLDLRRQPLSQDDLVKSLYSSQCVCLSTAGTISIWKRGVNACRYMILHAIVTSQGDSATHKHLEYSVITRIDLVRFQANSWGANVKSSKGGEGCTCRWTCTAEFAGPDGKNWHGAWKEERVASVRGRWRVRGVGQ